MSVYNYWLVLLFHAQHDHQIYQTSAKKCHQRSDKVKFHSILIFYAKVNCNKQKKTLSSLSERVMGFEPTNTTLGRWCLTTWRHPHTTLANSGGGGIGLLVFPNHYGGACLLTTCIQQTNTTFSYTPRLYNKKRPSREKSSSYLFFVNYHPLIL